MGEIGGVLRRLAKTEKYVHVDIKRGIDLKKKRKKGRIS